MVINSLWEGVIGLGIPFRNWIFNSEKGLRTGFLGGPKKNLAGNNFPRRLIGEGREFRPRGRFGGILPNVGEPFFGGQGVVWAKIGLVGVWA